MKIRKSSKVVWCKESALSFFENSDLLDRMVLRPIDHVKPNWELMWDQAENQYVEEEGSFAGHINVLIANISDAIPPENYHHYENKNAILYSEVKSGRIALSKNKKIWIDTSTGKPISKDMVGHMIEQATSSYIDIPDSVLAAAGRMAKAMEFGDDHFDSMEWGHMEMLAIILMDILFRRSDNDPSYYTN